MSYDLPIIVERRKIFGGIIEQGQIRLFLKIEHEVITHFILNCYYYIFYYRSFF